ncbi:hypothetical protein BDQ17DRAFT_1346662 [Cyathus striatus]|nr:hypothetical protein BDQ17DRAFT_1346662 [Cyathus striatus]
MSVVSSISVFSNNSSAWGINARLAFAMDNILAVAVGLTLRFTLDLVTKQNFRLSCSLIGLWEGVVSLHFINKMPYSYDPYIAFSIRLFVDYWLTESFYRLVIVLIWFAVGMALADVAPGVWKDTGLHRVWRRFRRDLYIMSAKVPRVNVFPRTRTVRFSPSRAPSVTEDASSLISPSVATPTITSRQGPPTTRVIPPTPSPAKLPRKRHTDSDLGSVLGLRPPDSGFGTAYSRYSSVPRRPSDTMSELSTPTNQDRDLDDANISSSSSDSSSATTIEEEARNAPDIPDEAPITIQTKQNKPEKDEERGITPRPTHIHLPPTPADSSRAFEYEPAPPPTATMPMIPDTFDAPGFSDWENVTKEDAKGAEEAAPQPPPKITKMRKKRSTLFGEQTASQPPPLNDLLGWGTDRPPSYSEPLAGNGTGGAPGSGNHISHVPSEEALVYVDEPQLPAPPTEQQQPPPHPPKRAGGGDGWTAEREAELSRAEKALGKMVRKAERRYISALEASSLNSPPAELDLSTTLVPAKVEERIEEALELHLKPSEKSLKFTVTIAKAKTGRTQRPIVSQTLDAYNLPYTNIARSFTINLPESQYAEWLEKNRRTDVDE